MLYQPINFLTEGFNIVDKTYGAGVVTQYGAYLTGEIPPFARIFVTAYIPRQTIFERMDGNKEVYQMPPNLAVGVQKLNITPRKKTSHHFSVQTLELPGVDVNLHDAKKGNFDVIIKERDSSSFLIYAQVVGTANVFQPFNGWVWRKIGQ